MRTSVIDGTPRHREQALLPAGERQARCLHSYNDTACSFIRGATRLVGVEVPLDVRKNTLVERGELLEDGGGHVCSMDQPHRHILR